MESLQYGVLQAEIVLDELESLLLLLCQVKEVIDEVEEHDGAMFAGLDHFHRLSVFVVIF